ncbi:hypothetical protein CSV77_14410 [Sporosarcina sp. P16b]|uniref:hypothetical protein n=1 Tax=Sporosarcina sp. P16b TaxID=2048261 RepID=UPI000C170620|nr:hypothetical protein [Sporosarcina sp. P16b]PIC69356.1 hypothetical protein CSV77_14410 [Sporosarcina sp. P16b]
MLLFGSRTITQIAFIVEDIIASAARLGDLPNLEIPPKIESEAAEVTQVAYKGEAKEADALFWSSVKKVDTIY